MPFIAPIIEGHGEIDALPALLYRIHEAMGGTTPLRVNPPIRVKAASFVRDHGEFRRYVLLAANKAKQAPGGDGSVLILLDCDDGCPATLGPQLLNDACRLRPDVPMFVALAYREYETWLLASAPSLRGVASLPLDFSAPPHFQEPRDATGYLHRHMPGGYDPVRHGAAFSRRLDVDLARRAPSFDRLYRHVGRLVAVNGCQA